MTAVTAMSENEIYIFYGSQTGQAETIAELIHESTEEHGIKSTLMCLRKAEEAFRIVSEGAFSAVFVCSTTGDGELPENARKFMRMLSRKTNSSDHLSCLQYALLGLGDTNYSTFCGGPKTLEKGLKKLGAKSFYPTGYADDGTDLEEVVEPWIEGLWPVLKAHLAKRRTAGEKSLEVGSDVKDEKVEEITEKLKQSAIDAKPPNGLAVESEEKQQNFGSITDVSSHDHEESTDSGKLSAIKDVKPADSETEKTCDVLSAKQLEVESESLLYELSNNTDGTLPPLTQPFLSYDVSEQDTCDQLLTQVPLVSYPIAADDVFHSAKIDAIEKLTAENAVKTAYCVTLQVPDGFSYEPGDSFGIVVPNPDEEVDWLLKRLSLLADRDKTVKITIDPNTKKKNAKVPNYIPNFTTIRHVLKNCLEIRSVPKRAFLRALFDYTTSEHEKNVLKQLCRKESMDDFVKYVREPNLNIIDILAALRSCSPPFSLLVEHLPRLKARQYSAASSSAAHPGKVRFVFNVVNFERTCGRSYARNGLATGYLSSLAIASMPSGTGSPSTDRILTIFGTKNSSFRLPQKVDNPLIMVGPGTGVAPFIGFLESLRLRRSAGDVIPDAWLFYGCRHKKRDFLFEGELKAFTDGRILGHLVVAFSRDNLLPDGAVDESLPRYVQDHLKLKSAEIADLMLRKNAVFYVCGDAKNMAKDVRETVLGIFSEEMTESESSETLKKMVKEGRYKEDVWT